MVSAVSLLCFFIEFGFRLAFRRNKPLVEDEANRNANCEGASAESKSKDFVIARAAVPASKLIKIDDVASKTNAERPTEQGQWFERRRANAIVITRDLIVATEVDRTEHAPDIGSPDLRR